MKNMKKIGLLCLALVLALGAMGIGYSAWTDTITINGTVQTGKVCLKIEKGTYSEINNCPPSVNNFPYPADLNWSGWVKSIGNLSCPMGYKFDSKTCTDKDVAYITFDTVKDADGNIKALNITIHNAYPHYLGWITFEVCNCDTSTIPIRLEKPVISQSPYLVIEYRDGVGEQLEPGACHEVSLYVGVVQHEGYYNGSGVWIVDDPAQPLTPQNTDLTFTITVTGIQWDKY